MRSLRLTGALLAVAAVTGVFTQLLLVNATTAGFVYLITILLIASIGGLLESLVASLAATLCFNYFFFPPVRTFTIADPHNWVALTAFLLTSLIASHLSQRAKSKTREAFHQQQEMERLYSLGRAILLTDLEQPVGPQIAREIARIYGLSAVGIYDWNEDKIHAAGPENLSDLERKLHVAAAQGILFRESQTFSVVIPIRLGQRPIGCMALSGSAPSDSGLQALANLVAIGLERVRAQQASSRAEAARQSEAFKSTLLDALAHEFQTPLTSVRAAASALLSAGVTKPHQQRDLLSVIEQEAERLSDLVTEATNLARIEAGMLQLHRQPQGVRALVKMSLGEIATTLKDRVVNLHVAADLPDLHVDSELARLVLRHLLDNAVKYSPPASPISISAESLGQTVVICVRNEGPGIAEAEQSKVFEKFYRGAEARPQVAGTGMGLAIAQEIVRAHGGDLRVESNPGKGSEFLVCFPTAKKGVRA